MAQSADGENKGVFRVLFELLKLIWHIVCAFLEAVFHCFVSKPKKSLEDEVVLVTGAARGLGREMALKFASQKAILVLWDLDEEGVQLVKSEIEANGGRAHAYKCDVSNFDEVNEVGTRVRQQVGDVTIVVNNAGILQNVFFTDLDVNRIRKTIEVNLLAHFWIDKFFLPKMMEMKKGHIVAISSIAGLKGWQYLADYSASKFGIVGLMEVLEEEMRTLGLGELIRFTTVCPLTMDTGLCQKPTSRFPSIFPILDVKSCAHKIVEAVQRNERVITIPKNMLFFLKVSRLFPYKVDKLIGDFIQYNMNQNTLDP